MMDNQQLWDRALGELELTVSKANFGTWFKNTSIAKQEDGIVYLNIPNFFVKDWLLNKFHKTILKALRTSDPEIRNIEYVIAKIDDKNKPTISSQPFKPQPINTLGLGDLYINRESNLNPKYVFDTLIVGPFNEVAVAASQAVVKNPGTNYNPLFIYGGTGLGKTHLIQAVGNHIKKNHDNKKIFYTTTESFMNDYVNAVTANKAALFKEKYRKYDVFIMDDVQFLSNKEKTQEELFHLFNFFYENNKQIIFSSDKSPKYIPNLEERLRSRFEGGMIIDVNRPDFESRLAILKSKASTHEFPLPHDILEYIANVVQDSIRELEGALTSIVLQTQLKKRSPTLAEVKSLIKNSVKPQRTISIKDVLRVVSGFYNIDERSLYEKTRRKEVVKPRQVIMYILREDFNTSYPYIGQKLGDRDHTTVIHACKKIKGDIQRDTVLNQEIDQIRVLLYNNQ